MIEENKQPFQPEDVTPSNSVSPEVSQPAESEPQISLTPEELADEKVQVADNSAILGQADPIAATVNYDASEAEKLAKDPANAIAEVDYQTMDMPQLVVELEKLLENPSIPTIRKHVTQLAQVFREKYNHFIEERKDEFAETNQEEGAVFHYDFPLKRQFDQLVANFRKRRDAHQKLYQETLEANANKRETLLEELKALVNAHTLGQNNISALREIQDKWRSIGPVPSDKHEHYWRTYHFYVDQFYDLLHMDREARDMEFRSNLEQKERLIERAQLLLQEPDISKAFRELQDLHRIWKEDIGPVAREKREEIWTKFSEITQAMHKRREDLMENIRQRETQHLKEKQAVIAKIKELTALPANSHNEWQTRIEEMEQLRSAFFTIGRVPNEHNEATWSSFKEAVRDFNGAKNIFYKSIKKDQQENLNKKMALVERAKSLKDSDDFEATTPIMKQIQEEWKNIGHVPRKFSDSIWKEFKEACNAYFDRYKASRAEADAEELANFEKKKSYLDTLRTFEMTGEHKIDLDNIKAHIETWKSLGKVPFNKRHIEGKFNKILDGLFAQLSASKKEADLMRFASRLDELKEGGAQRIEQEKIFILRKIDEIQQEIFQLENNIQFFANAKNDNPLVAEVRKNIERHKTEMNSLREKLKQLREIQNPEE